MEVRGFFLKSHFTFCIFVKVFFLKRGNGGVTVHKMAFNNKSVIILCLCWSASIN